MWFELERESSNSSIDCEKKPFTAASMISINHVQQLSKKKNNGHAKFLYSTPLNAPTWLIKINI